MLQNRGSIIPSPVPPLDKHWRQSALNSAGALQDGGGEFRGIYTLSYTIKFRGEPKSGGASAPAAPPTSAPMHICVFSHLCELHQHVASIGSFLRIICHKNHICLNQNFSPFLPQGNKNHQTKLILVHLKCTFKNC